MTMRSRSVSSSPDASALYSHGTDDSLLWTPPPPPPADPTAGWADISGDVAGEGYTGYNQTKVDVVAVPCPGADPVETWARSPFPEDYFHPTRPGLAGPRPPPPSRQQQQHGYFRSASAAGSINSSSNNKRHSAVETLAGDVPLSPGINRPLPRAEYHWVRQGIRSAAPPARVLLYRHRALAEGVTLEVLAQDLLDQLRQLRRQQRGQGRRRPLFFVAHSIGGLVVKLALVRANEAVVTAASRNRENDDDGDDSARAVMYDCHGVSFFGAPHRGSSYMTMPLLRESIQGLLHLHAPLPRSLAGEVTLNNRALLEMHDRFADIASELRIWTFYEALDSQLYRTRARGGDGGGGNLLPHETQFGAPLVSIKSALVNVRQEKVIAIDGDHAHVASFGKDNLETMTTYLRDLAAAITKAERLSDKYTHTPLGLLEKVRVELVGFHANPDPEPPASAATSSSSSPSALWLYSSRHPLGEFLRKGPEVCLDERLRTPARRRRRSSARPRRATGAATAGPEVPGGRRELARDGDDENFKAVMTELKRDDLDIGVGIQHSDIAAVGIDRGLGADGAGSPGIVVTTPLATKRPPALGGGSPPIEAETAGPASSTSAPDPPEQRPRHSLTVPAFGTPDYGQSSRRRRSNETTHSAGSEPLIEEDEREGGRGDVAVTDDEGGDDPRTKRTHTISTQQARRPSTASDPGAAAATAAARLLPGGGDRMASFAPRDELLVGFSRPMPSLRRFTWVHLTFNNPVWAEAILRRIGEAHGQSLARLFNDEHWVNRRGLGRHAQSQPSYVNPGCNYVPSSAAAGAGAVGSPRLSPHATLGSRPSPVLSPSLSPSLSPPLPTAGDPAYLYLHMPYLNFDTYRAMVRRRRLVERRLRHGRARPVPADVAALESLELRVLWQYLGFDPPLSGRRTLDQFGNPSIRDTYSRDDDQMLYKLTKERSGQARVQTPSGERVSGKASGEVARAAEMAARNRTWAGRDQLSPAITSPKTAETAAATPSAPMGRFAALRRRIMGWSGGSKRADDREGDRDVCRGEMDVENLRDGKVLMVDQLWLWEITDNTLVTFFPKRESSPREGTLFEQADLRNSVFQELNGDLTGVTENALDLAAFIVLHAVTVLLDRSSHPDLDVIRIFEEAIGLLEERMTENLKRFRLRASRAASGSGGGGGGDESGDDLLSLSELSSEDDDDQESHDGEDEDNQDNSTAAIKRRQRRELAKTERANRDNTSAMLELRDMEDELRTLARLFGAQEAVVGAMRGHYAGRAELRDRTRNGRLFLAEALHRLGEYREWADAMLGRVDATKKDYEKMLEMAQRQVQVDDVHWSRLQAELASTQNLAVTIFTTFTVVFLPMSFFVSLFGMNASEWQGAGMPSLVEIGAVSLPASVAVIVLALVAGFNTHAQAAIRSAYRLLVFLAAVVLSGPASARRATAQRRRRRREREDRLRRRKWHERERAERTRLRQRERQIGGGGQGEEESNGGDVGGGSGNRYDFWASMRGYLSRRRRYEIPDVNKMAPPTLAVS